MTPPYQRYQLYRLSLLCAALAVGSSLHAQEISTLKVQGDVYLLSGAGGNVVVQIGDMGVLVVDTGLAQSADKVVAAIRKLSNGPIQYIVNTHFHPDHTGGNEIVRKAGVTITGANVTGNLTDAALGAQIIAHENVLNRMSAPTGKQSPTPADVWPTETYVEGAEGTVLQRRSHRGQVPTARAHRWR